MKIFVVGGSGVIGSKLVQYFSNGKFDVEYTYLKNKILHSNGGHQLDITNRKDTLALLKKMNPDVVIHSTALTNVDLCETDRNLAHKINVEGTKNIIDVCKIINTKLVYVSTSFVFDGKKQQYFENDETFPTTYYGYTKLKGEQLVVDSELSYLILRTDQPYCWVEKWQHTNSVLRVINTIRSGKVLNEITDWYNTPTYVPDFVKATWELIRRNLTGIFHVVGSDYINRYDWSLLVAEIFEIDKNMINPIKSDILHLPAKRVNVNLKNQKLEQKAGFQMKGLKEGLLEMLKENPLS